ncbi:MAG: hypothetical protein AVDCRST_MAG27-3547, partial [uncultured Craurococcus sp.]
APRCHPRPASGRAWPLADRRAAAGLCRIPGM